MPTTSFPEYAKAITLLIDTLLASGQARVVNLQVDQRSMLRGFISGILAFEDDSELHFREFVDLTQSEPRLMYAYHYQDSKEALVFRTTTPPIAPSSPWQNINIPLQPSLLRQRQHLCK